MLILPIPILIGFLLGLLSLAILIAGCWLLYRAFRRFRSLRTRVAAYIEPRSAPGEPLLNVKERPRTHPLSPAEALRDSTVLAPLLISLALLLFTFEGRQLVHAAFPGGDRLPAAPQPQTVQDLTRPDGTRLHIETLGPEGAPTLVFTHGWGADNTEWDYAKRDLAGRFRLVFWDLPGLGQSSQPPDRDYALDKMAADLEAVITAVNGRAVLLIGHSIGGMINLTFCRMFPDRLGSQVAGLAEVDTSYTNPVETTSHAQLSKALQKPVAEPLLHAGIWFSPAVRAMNWLSYRNGTAHMMNAKSSFAGSETWAQLDHVSKYQYKSSPAVVARGTLAMFHWDATPVLPNIGVPVLIVVGRQDTTTLPSASERMRQAIPKAALTEVTPAAHYGLLEQNQRYNAELAGFAQSVGQAHSPAMLSSSGR